MPNFGAKISSAYVSIALMREFIDALPSVMRDIYGNRHLIVSYGWGCNLHPELWYKPMRVALDTFPYFIEDSIEQRIFVMRGSDLLIESPDSGFCILICHESDIHLDGTDDESINKIVDSFPRFDFRTAGEWRAASYDDPDGTCAKAE
jgi:hypothetical protein